LFLDELAETSLALQAKLLRALQERTLRPVGSDHEVPFDARAVVATNRDLDTEVMAGRFRADLYYRVQVIQMALPPLRARGADVLLLAQHFLDHYAARTSDRARTLTPACATRLLSYPWPGNVRELQNCMERAVALGGTEIDVGDLPDRIRRHRCTPMQSTPIGSLLTLAELERRHIREVLSVVGGRRGEAARILGIDRKTLYRKVMQYGLDKERRRSGQYRITDEGSGGADPDRLDPPQSSRAKR
jgi:DNA-binding NtrC family response regulator